MINARNLLMGFSGQENFHHKRSDKIGILITNLGTPDHPTPKAVKRYLKQFLSDPRVVEVPKPIWWIILNLFILNTRPKASAKLYESIWTEQGSPMKRLTEDQLEALKKILSSQLDSETDNRIIVDYAMRYGSPSIESTLEKMQNEGASKILILPLYPQYASSTTGSTFDAMSQHFSKQRWIPETRFINGYYDNPLYIEACSQQIKTFWENHSRSQKLVLSFHGLPKFHLDKGDPYYCHCQKTARLIAEKLSLNDSDYITTFQSRFGRTEWLRPFTDETLKSLPLKSVYSVDVFCPGFSVDCLETLEEIQVENRSYFLGSGGNNYQYIPALNSSQEHIECLSSLILNNIDDWLKLPERDSEKSEKEYKKFSSAYPSHPNYSA